MFRSAKWFSWTLAVIFAWVFVVQVGPLAEARDWSLLACLSPIVVALVVLVLHAWRAPDGAFIGLKREVKRRHTRIVWGCIVLMALSLLAAKLVQDVRMYD